MKPISNRILIHTMFQMIHIVATSALWYINEGIPSIQKNMSWILFGLIDGPGSKLLSLIILDGPHHLQWGLSENSTLYLWFSIAGLIQWLLIVELIFLSIRLKNKGYKKET